MATPENMNSSEVLVGQKKWSVLLSELKAEVSEWNKKWEVSWDRLIRDTDKIKKEWDTLKLIRNNTTYDIASLKSEMSKEASEVQKVPTTKKEITVVAWDSISKILNTEFGSGQYKYGDKNGPSNMKDGWDKILIWEKLTLETDGKTHEKDMYLYTLSRDKNGKKESITFVSSKLLLKGVTPAETIAPQSAKETTTNADTKKIASTPNAEAKVAPLNGNTSPKITPNAKKPIDAGIPGITGIPSFEPVTPGFKDTLNGNVKSTKEALAQVPVQPKKDETKKLSEKQENTPNTESLKNIFPTASTAELEKLASGSTVKIGKNEYQIANLSGWKAKTGEGKTFDFAKWVVAESTDIILIVKNEDGSKLAIAHQKLKSGRYSTAYRQ
jgi:hypothetical protein